MHLPPARPTAARRLLAVAAVTTAVVLAPLAGSALPLGFAAETHDHGTSAAAERDAAASESDDAAAAESQSDDAAAETDDAASAPDDAAEPEVVAAGRDDRDRAEDRDGDRAGNRDADENGNRQGDGNGARASSDDTVGAGGKDGKNNGLDILGRDCSESNLDAHDGFQASPACVSTQMGEVAAEDKLPALLITDAPRTVAKGEAFELKVRTRNLVRDRFLGAAAGGYYLESSFLNDDGLQRGHFHTACRILPSDGEVPDSSEEPAFFLATEDGGGGTEPDTVTIEVPGVDDAGELQCTSWAGDGSHRTPMMTKANQTPAIDSVRITVTG